MEDKFHSLVERSEQRSPKSDLRVKVEGTAKSPGAKMIEFRVVAQIRNLMGKRFFVSATSDNAHDAVVQASSALEKQLEKLSRLKGHARAHRLKSRWKNKRWIPFSKNKKQEDLEAI